MKFNTDMLVNGSVNAKPVLVATVSNERLIFERNNEEHYIIYLGSAEAIAHFSCENNGSLAIFALNGDMIKRDQVSEAEDDREEACCRIVAEHVMHWLDSEALQEGKLEIKPGFWVTSAEEGVFVLEKEGEHSYLISQANHEIARFACASKLNFTITTPDGELIMCVTDHNIETLTDEERCRIAVGLVETWSNT